MKHFAGVCHTSAVSSFGFLVIQEGNATVKADACFASCRAKIRFPQGAVKFLPISDYNYSLCSVIIKNYYFQLYTLTMMILAQRAISVFTHWPEEQIYLYFRGVQIHLVTIVLVPHLGLNISDCRVNGVVVGGTGYIHSEQISFFTDLLVRGNQMMITISSITISQKT